MRWGPPGGLDELYLSFAHSLSVFCVGRWMCECPHIVHKITIIIKFCWWKNFSILWRLPAPEEKNWARFKLCSGYFAVADENQRETRTQEWRKNENKKKIECYCKGKVFRWRERDINTQALRSTWMWHKVCVFTGCHLKSVECINTYSAWSQPAYTECHVTTVNSTEKKKNMWVCMLIRLSNIYYIYGTSRAFWY